MAHKRTSSKWITPKKRLAIYLRDGFKCTYCGRNVQMNATLDHLTPRAKGGSNSETNLVTCCLHCNSSKGEMSLTEFMSSFNLNGFSRSNAIKKIRNVVRWRLTKYLKRAEELRRK